MRFLDAGAVNFIFRVSHDTCLYVEPLALRLISQNGGNPDISEALEYYFGANSILAADVAPVLYNLNITEIQARTI